MGKHDYKSGLRPWLRWMNRPLLVAFLVLTLPFVIIVTTIACACAGAKGSVLEWWTFLRSIRKRH